LLSAAIAMSHSHRLAAADEFDPIRERIRAALVKQNVPSLAVAVARDGQIVWEQGFGWANREERTPASEHTLYSLASISKPITTTGLMILQERGLLDLDRPIVLGHQRPRELVRRFGKNRAGDEYPDKRTQRQLCNDCSAMPHKDSQDTKHDF